MDTREGGRHGVDSLQPLDPGDYAGLPDLSKRATVITPVELDPMWEPCTWVSEVYRNAPGVRRIHHSDAEAQG
jgi:hypothetical protein